jgi:hypothetical protein
LTDEQIIHQIGANLLGPIHVVYNWPVLGDP